MAWKYLAASGAIGTINQEHRVKKLTINGTDPGATDPGTVTLKTGGTSGTTQVEFKVLFGHTEQFTLPNMIADYINLTDAKCIVEFYKIHGV